MGVDPVPEKGGHPSLGWAKETHRSLPRDLARETGGKGGCARSVGPRTVTTSSRGRVRVVRNPLNVMARLTEVVGGNGTSGGVRCARPGVSGPDCNHGWNGVLGISNRKSKPGNGLRGWKICRLGSLVIFGLSRVGWLPEY
ncbi:hypothetical protein CRG98_024586 [Punica granatum]|uniref:Uncharacterized protein n=1 Tax=Punica granatum TaxID=22663 RepID=A0A2I0JFI1_PUNGR|nr:hypothetical protein CRG98_024586 [Punica granatum]